MRVWAIAATVAAFTFFNTTLFLLVRGRSRPQAASATSFATLSEASVPGRYRWLEEGEDKGVITLQPDHSFIAADGAAHQRYKWELTRDAILIIFQKDVARFDSIESPGVYVGLNENNQRRRMEKTQ